MNSPRIALAACALVALALAGCGGGMQKVRVEVTDAGFTPPSTDIHRGRPVTITFERMADKTCATDVVFPQLKKGYDLPLHKPVEVTLTAAEIADTVKFNCSMNMIHGVLVAK